MYADLFFLLCYEKVGIELDMAFNTRTTQVKNKEACAWHIPCAHDITKNHRKEEQESIEFPGIL